MSLTPTELAEKVGVSAGGITTKARRMKKYGELNGYDGGFGINKPLPQQVVDYYLAKVGEVERKEPKVIESPVKSKEVVSFTEHPVKLPTPTPVEGKPEPTAPEPEQKELFDLGELVFFHPSAKFFYVLVLIIGQAWIFSSLAERVYQEKENHLPFAALFVFGLLIEFGGIMLSKVFSSKINKSDEIGNLWLFVFALWQILVDLSYFKLIGPHSDLIGQYIVAVSVPLGILAYSVIYFKSRK